MMIRSRRMSGYIVVTGLLVALGPPAAAAQSRSSEPQAPLPGAPTITRPHLALAAFQMEEGVDPRDAWLATGLRETLAWRLRRVPALVVVPTVRIHQARRELQDDPATLPDPPRVLMALGADLVLTGQCSGNPDAVVLKIKLMSVGPGSTVRAEITLPTGRVFEVVDAATHWALEQLGVSALPAGIERLIFAAPARSPGALEYYARAVSAARQGRLEQAYRRVRQALGYDDRYRPALAMLVQLDLQRGQAGFASAGARLRSLSDLARMHADPLDRAAAELGRGLLAQVTGAFDAAYTRVETSLAMSYEQADPYGQIAALNSLSDLYLTRRVPAGAELSEGQLQSFRRQNLRRSAEWQEVLLELLRRLDDVVAEAPAANKLALIYEELGEREGALGMHRRSLQAAQRCGSQHHQASAWLYLGQWYQREQRWPEALEAGVHCLHLASDPMKPVAHLALAGIHESMDAPAKALAEFEAAYETLRLGDDLANQLICARKVAQFRMQLGRRDTALAALLEAIDLAHALQLPEEAALRDQLTEWKRQTP